MVCSMEDEYLQQRLEDQISWYSKKSQSNQRWFKVLRLIEIISAAFIPFLAGIGGSLLGYQIIVGALGVIIAICAGLLALNKYQENWVEYRTTAETLKHEKYLFSTKCAPYNKEDAFCILVQRVEGLISKENSQWSLYASNEEKHNR